MRNTSSNISGILIMCLTMGLQTANDVLTKLATTVITVPQFIAGRGIIVCALTVLWVILAGHARLAYHIRKPFVLLRCSFDCAVTLSFFFALSKMPIADLMAVFLSTPLITTAAAAIFYGEKVRWQGWLAVLVGFMGVILVVKPAAAGLNLYVFLALFSAVCASSRDLVTRKINSEVPSLIISLATALASTLLGIAITAAGLIGQDVSLLPFASVKIWIFLVAAAVFVTAGNYGFVLAYRYSSLSVISPFRYTSLLWAMLAGVLIWNQFPDAKALTGSALIIASGLYLLHKARVEHRGTQLVAAEPGV